MIALIVANYLLFTFGRLSYLLFPFAGTIFYHGIQIFSSTYAGWISARFLSPSLAIATIAGIAAYIVGHVLIPTIAQFVLDGRFLLEGDRDEYRRLVFYSVLIFGPFAAVLGFLGGKLGLSKVNKTNLSTRLNK